ncbi:MAG: sugar phosphate nucleotidyltransferase [Microgenomates group bacterium]
MKKIKNILILAAGDSTRFWPLRDKQFFSFLGKPLLVHLIEDLLDYGQNIIVVSSSSIKDKLVSLVGNKVEIITQDSRLTGMAGAIFSAKNKINGEVLILNASDIINFNILTQFIDKLKKEKLKILLLAKKVKEYFPGGYLKLKGGRIVEIIEKPTPREAPSNMVKLVFDYFFDFQKLVKIIQNTKTGNDDQYEQAVTQLLKKYHQETDYILYDSFWYPIKYPWQVLPALKYFLGKLDGDKVKLGKNVKIGQGVKIVGPTYIGDNTIIGDFVLIRESIIENNCLIGAFSEVARSYLGEKVYLHRNYVGDSILDKNVLLGAGAVLANFRFDSQPIKNTYLSKLGSIIGEGSKIGANATILPGVKIGRNTFIGPLEMVDKDIEDNKFVFKGKISENKYRFPVK